MDQSLRQAFVRLILALEYALDESSFVSSDAWSFIEELGHFANDTKKIPEGARLVFCQFNEILGLRPGASEADLFSALQRHLGASDIDETSLKAGINFFRLQANGGAFTQETAEKKIELPWVPHKNYEFK
jgi:hypothetical protein